MGKHAHSLDQKILARMKATRTATIYAATDFLDLGGRNAVDQVLSRNCRRGVIRKVARGLYDLPRRDAVLGPLAPRPEAVAQALARRAAARLQVAGGAAAHALGLTDQVPVRVVYLTDGRSCQVRVGRSRIILRRASSRQMATAGRVSGTVIQALRWLGQRQVDAATVARLRRRLSPAHRRQLVKDLRYAPTWVAAIIRDLTRSDG